MLTATIIDLRDYLDHRGTAPFPKTTEPQQIKPAPLFWTCVCGCHVFLVTSDGILCPDCGSYQPFETHGGIDR
jgi:hypothetical protein